MDKKKNKAAVELGKKSYEARLKKYGKEYFNDLARKMTEARKEKRHKEKQG